MGLTVHRVKAETRPGRYGDGGTLFLLVTPTGSKCWVQRLTIRGKRHDIGLGSVALVSLAKARIRSLANRVTVAEGGDPLAAKRKSAMPTFQQAAARTLDAKRAHWRSGKTAANWTQSLAMYADPVFGDRPINVIDRADVLRVLTPLWQAKPAVANKLRQRLKATFAWAQAHGYADQNPAGEAIDGALPPQAPAQHHRALPFREVSAAFEAVAASRSALAVRACLRFLILTACRSGEARGATWSEIDTDAAEWRIPAGRMKTGVEHRVPLTAAALAVLEDVRPLRDASSLLFPSPTRRRQSLSDMALSRALRAAGVAAVPHGFRASFRTWASERTDVQHAVAEMALAHTVGSAVERSYARSDLFDKRRALMVRWEAFVTETPGRLVQFNTGGRLSNA